MVILYVICCFVGVKWSMFLYNIYIYISFIYIYIYSHEKVITGYLYINIFVNIFPQPFHLYPCSAGCGVPGLPWLLKAGPLELEFILWSKTSDPNSWGRVWTMICSSAWVYLDLFSKKKHSWIVFLKSPSQKTISLRCILAIAREDDAKSMASCPATEMLGQWESCSLDDGKVKGTCLEKWVWSEFKKFQV